MTTNIFTLCHKCQPYFCIKIDCCVCISTYLTRTFMKNSSSIFTVCQMYLCVNVENDNQILFTYINKAFSTIRDKIFQKTVTLHYKIQNNKQYNIILLMQLWRVRIKFVLIQLCNAFSWILTMYLDIIWS